MPAQTAKSKYVDVVITGEGERTLLELVDCLRKKGSLEEVKGICFEKDGKVVFTQAREFEDISTLPEPPYHLVNVKDYFINLYQSKNTLSLLTGKGCPHRCKYCYNASFNKRRWRGLPAETVVKRIKKLAEFGAETIDLVDDNFFTDKERVERIFELLEKENIKVKFMTNCRVDYIARFDMEFLKRARKAGIHELFVGIESGSDKVLSMINKDSTVEQALEANKKLREAGIKPIYSFMAGFPGETINDLKKTVDLMVRLLKENPNASLTALKIYTPFPGTELYEECLRHGFKPPQSLEEWGSFNYNTAHYTWNSKKMTKLLEKLSYITYFLDIRSMQKHLAKNNPLLSALIWVYGNIVRFRCKHHFYAFTPEVPIMKFFYKAMSS